MMRMIKRILNRYLNTVLHALHVFPTVHHYHYITDQPVEVIIAAIVMTIVFYNGAQVVISRISLVSVNHFQ